MKKIPTLFNRTFENHIVTSISREVASGLEWVLKGEGIATVKWDGACWVKCDRKEPRDKWFWSAYDRTRPAVDGTYEAIGPHFQTNPYHLEYDILRPHGKDVIEVERSFEGIHSYLETHAIEGIVFWKDGEPKCKIKSRDFGIKWRDKVDGSEMNKQLCRCPLACSEFEKRNLGSCISLCTMI